MGSRQAGSVSRRCRRRRGHLTTAAELLDVEWIISPGCERSYRTDRFGRLDIAQPRRPAPLENPSDGGRRRRPHGRRRSATTRSSIDAAVACGIWAGREERSAMPARPSALALDAACHDLGRYAVERAPHGLRKSVFCQRQRHRKDG